MWTFLIYTILGMIGSRFPEEGRMRKLSKRLFRFFPSLIILGTVLGVSADLAGWEGSAFYNEMLILTALTLCSLPVYLILAIVGKMRAKKLAPQSIARYSNMPAIVASTLPKTVAGRRKIVEKFNEKYNLFLTSQQIESIVSGSFQSVEWQEEILAMDQTYTSVNSWFAGPRGWLRAFLKAFNVQDISTDFAYQKQLCLNYYRQVFTSFDIASFATIEQCIEAINQSFFTSFDDATFMIGYRFLQANGVNITLPNSMPLMVDQELQDLTAKYENTPGRMN